MGVSKNNGIPKSSILIGFSMIFGNIHFGGNTTIFGNIQIYLPSHAKNPSQLVHEKIIFSEAPSSLRMVLPSSKTST